jgi:hypothetical protein
MCTIAKTSADAEVFDAVDLIIRFRQGVGRG